MDKVMLEKILTKKASEEEKELFFQAIESDEKLRHEYIRFKNLWAVSSINNQLVSETRKKQLFSEFWDRTKQRESGSVNKVLLVVLKYAAIIFISLGIGYILREISQPESGYSTVREFSAAKGSIATILLSDSSKIWLNANSDLTINEKTPGHVVVRLDGEAYFEIKHNDKRSFIVDLGKIQVKDMGTKFNIKAYDEDEHIVATLIDGKIDIQNKLKQKLISMNPNDCFSFYKKENSFILRSIDPELVTGWKEGKFVFLDLTLEEICNELEKWYNVDITINTKQYEKEKYTSVIKRSTSIKHVLEMLKITTKIEYEIVEQDRGPDLIFLN